MKNGTYAEVNVAPYPLEKINVDVLVCEIIRFCGLKG
jgi:hypothetical protein